MENSWSRRMLHSAFMIIYLPLVLWVPAVSKPIELALRRITKEKGVENSWLAWVWQTAICPPTFATVV